MAWPVINVSKKKLNNVYIIVHILDCVLLISSVLIFVKAIHFIRNTGHFIKMISTAEGNTLPSLIAVIALCGIPIHVIGIYINIKLKDKEFEVDGRILNGMFYSICGTIFIATCTLCIVIYCAVHYVKLETHFHDGITSSMNAYAKGETSRDIDLLQTKFQCCGSKSYKEWFFIKWDTSMMEASKPGALVSDDVPFSCCLKTVTQPCIHNHMQAASSVYRFSPPQNSGVSMTGCQPVLVTKTKLVAKLAIFFLTLYTLCEIAVAIGKRIQQTSLVLDTLDKYETGPQKVWVFGSAPSSAASSLTAEDSQALLNDQESLYTTIDLSKSKSS